MEVTLQQVLDISLQDDNTGICLNCGEETEAWTTEPDARNYTCEYCGADEVFGADELLQRMA